MVKNYFDTNYEGNAFDELCLKFAGENLSPAQYSQLNKFMLLFLLGHLLDMPALNSILSSYGITSSILHQKFGQLYHRLTIRKLLKLFEQLFEHHIYEQLSVIDEKHNSAWSRELVTVLLDDSVFKQWLSSFQAGQDYESCYGLFFSGQTKSAVYGFKIACLGICIDGIYYPLYFEFVSNKKKAENGGKVAALQSAQRLVKRYNKWKQACKDKGLIIPQLHFSCDDGYSDMELADCCKAADLIYISVPNKSHLFQINGESIKLREWIKQHYLEAERKHEQAQAASP